MMSRTYRKKKARFIPSDWYFVSIRNIGDVEVYGCEYLFPSKRTATKKEKAWFHRELSQHIDENSYINGARRKIRAAERRECKRVKFFHDYDDFDFHTADADKFWKGIMWYIY